MSASMINFRHIHHRNLIEGYNDDNFDSLYWIAWDILSKVPRLNEKAICKVQKIITICQDELASRYRDDYRDTNVTVGNWICPDHTLVEHLMNNWILDMRDYRKMNPKEMHIRFEHIHPFIDGNGRTGRLLMWWHECKLGKEPMLILNSEKEAYYEWFK
jgi:Fic family protein